MKKIILNLCLMAAVVLAASSCKGFLDTEPSSGIPYKGGIKTYNDAFSALAGVYDGLQESNVYYGARMIYYGDVRGDLMQATQPGRRTSGTYEMRYIPTNSPAIWTPPYDVIHRANNVIEVLDAGVVTDATEERINALKGQALCIRALAHFDLCRVYGDTYSKNNGASKGIPIVTKTVTSDYTPARNTVAEVFVQVVADLKQAMVLLNTPSVGKVKNAGFFNFWAAEALLSRVYLYMGTDEALKSCVELGEDVITVSPYRLWTNGEYVAAWSQGATSELIFEIINKSSDDWVDREAIGYLMSEGGYSDLLATPLLVASFLVNANDVRGKMLLASRTGPFVTRYGAHKVWCNKYPGRSDNSPIDTRVNNVPVLRLSEVYLNVAEAAVRLGGTYQTTADNRLNAIIQRANPLAAAITADLDEVLYQRGLELFGEGHRYFDLLRNNLTIDRSGDRRWSNYVLLPQATTFTRDSYLAILPIPSGEIDANTVIEQNAQY